MEKLTKRQQEILDLIEQEQRTTGETPSLREISAHFGFSSQNAARDHVQALRRKGALTQRPGKARSLQLSSTHAPGRSPVKDVPLYGSIPAGFSTREEQESEGCISVDVGTLGIHPAARPCPLQVRGASMIGRNICDGDFAVCEHGVIPRDGQVVAALIDNESTLKTFVQKKNRTYLSAENPDYPDLMPAEELMIQGVVVAMIRKYGD